MPMRNDSNGFVMVTVMITVLSLTLMVGGIARWSVSQESRAIEEDLLTVNQYWACVAAWERLKGTATATGTTTHTLWTVAKNDLINTIQFENSDGTGLVTFQVGDNHIEGNAEDDTLLWDNSSNTGGTVTIYPVIALINQGANVFNDYEQRWNNKFTPNPDEQKKLQITYCIDYEDDNNCAGGEPANDPIRGIVVTSWRYGI